VTSISTTADLLRLLREDPDFRDQVRSLLLTQELIELPERFARFESFVIQRFESLESSMERQFTEVRGDIAEIRSDVAKNTSDITEMRGDIAEVRSDVAKNTSDITEMRGDIGRLQGAEYERKVSRVFTSYASTAFRRRHNRSLRRNRLLLSAGQSPTADFEEILDSAEVREEISEEELEELRQADAVMVGQDQGEAVYFVGEFSVTVNNHDIDRAIGRAGILRKVTGSDAWPMVIGDTIPDPQRARAEAEGIAFRQVAE
jgi:hypothetical protein